MWAKDIYKFGESVFNTFTDLIEKHDCWIEYYSYDGRRKRDRLFSI